MLIETLFHLTLLLATLLCTLVAGFVLAFALVVMPGLDTLEARAFLRAFQVIDRVIQDNQPLFMVIWVGSVVALLAAVLLGLGQLEGPRRLLIIFVAVAYLGGTQAPTAVVNVPLNNHLQTLDLAALNSTTLQAERNRFEPRWNRWNVVRTACALLSSTLLLSLLLRL